MLNDNEQFRFSQFQVEKVFQKHFFRSVNVKQNKKNDQKEEEDDIENSIFITGDASILSL